MPAGGLLTAAAITGGVGLGQTIYGAIKKRKDQQAANANVMPTYTIPGEEQSALQLAQSQAGQGMSDASKQAYLNNAGAGLAATNNAILRGGGDANTIGNAYNKYDTGTSNMALYDDQARMNHLQNLQSAFTRMSANKDKAWQTNQYQPWANKSQALGNQLAGDQNMIMSGINLAGSALSSGVNAYANRTKPLQPTGGQEQQPYNPGPQNTVQQPWYGQQTPSAGGWHAGMAASEPGAFSFPSFYGMDYQQ